MTSHNDQLSKPTNPPSSFLSKITTALSDTLKSSQSIGANGEVILRSRLKQKTGEPLFTKESIFQTTNPLARILRMVCVRNNITLKELHENHTAYGALVENKLPCDINTERSNLKRNIILPNITISLLERFFIIMNFKILDISFTLKDGSTGEIFEYKLSDAKQLTQEE